MSLKSILTAITLTPLFLFYSNCFVYSQGLNIKKEYWKNGKIRLEESYKEEQLEGLSRYFYENGIKMSEVNYTNGKKMALSHIGIQTARYGMKGVIDME